MPLEWTKSILMRLYSTYKLVGKCILREWLSLLISIDFLLIFIFYLSETRGLWNLLSRINNQIEFTINLVVNSFLFTIGHSMATLAYSPRIFQGIRFQLDSYFFLFKRINKHFLYLIIYIVWTSWLHDTTNYLLIQF